MHRPRTLYLLLWKRREREQLLQQHQRQMGRPRPPLQQTIQLSANGEASVQLPKPLLVLGLQPARRPVRAVGRAMHRLAKTPFSHLCSQGEDMQGCF